MTAASTPSSDQQVPPESDAVTRLAGRPGVIDRAVYGTIVVTSVLVVYDGWAKLRVLGAIAVILGPVVAIVIGHIFGASLAAYAAVRRRSTKHELLMIARRESRFLLVCAPQIVLLLVLKLAGLSLNEGVRVVIWASAASLGFLGWHRSTACRPRRPRDRARRHHRTSRRRSRTAATGVPPARQGPLQRRCRDPVRAIRAHITSALRRCRHRPERLDPSL